MNAKRAKHYRRVARERTIGQPNRAYTRAVRGKHPGVCISLHPDCTRAVYQRVKAEAMYCHRVRGLTGVVVTFGEGAL